MEEIQFRLIQLANDGVVIQEWVFKEFVAGEQVNLAEHIRYMELREGDTLVVRCYTKEE